MGQDMNKHSLSTSNFKKNFTFVIKIIVFACLLLGYIFFKVLPQYEQGYNASLIDKVNRLESIDEPKIVLLGNSNLAFGMDSPSIEEAMEMPVVNMGLHGGNGNAFHEEMAKYNVRQGDIYVICHNGYHDDDTITNPVTAWVSIENHMDLWKILRLKDMDTMVRSFPTYLKKCLGLYSSGTGNQVPDAIYARNAFNECGDVSALMREESRYTFEKEVEIPKIGDIAVQRINDLNEYLTERGAALVVASYPIGNGNITADASDFIEFQEQLAEKLDCPVISNYVDYMFDYKYFFDTYLHLNSEGVTLRTNQLIYDLKRWQESGTDITMADDPYTDIAADVNLPHINSIYDYLDALNTAKDRYTIMISAKEDALGCLDSDIVEGLEALGLSADWSDESGYSYIAVIEQGVVKYEKVDYKKIEISGDFDDGRMAYAIASGGCASSIMLNGQEYSENVRGLNFVVYSNETHRILDEATFDTCAPELAVTR